MTETEHKHRKSRGKRGTAALEYGLIFPVLILFLLGIMDMGRLMWTYANLYRAVEAGARCGAVDVTNCGTAAQIQATAAGAVWGMTVPAAAFGVSTTSGVRVSANYAFNFFMPGFSSINLTPSVCYISLTVTYGDDSCS
jgi:uncharacterized membrane protein